MKRVILAATLILAMATLAMAETDLGRTIAKYDGVKTRVVKKSDGTTIYSKETFKTKGNVIVSTKIQTEKSANGKITETKTDAMYETITTKDGKYSKGKSTTTFKDGTKEESTWEEKATL